MVRASKSGAKPLSEHLKTMDRYTTLAAEQLLATNEKITWGKLGADTPKYVIESDATIVAPLMFAKVLGW